MCYRPGTISFNRLCPHCGNPQCNEQMYCTECGELLPYIPFATTPEDRVRAFFDQVDDGGKSNADKVRERQKVLRRIATTDKNTSVETLDKAPDDVENGMVFEDGELIGLGIHIFNEDIYPLQSFEIYLRSCDLTGQLDLSGCDELKFVDLYHNKIEVVRTGYLPEMRIFGVQDNLLAELDVSEMPEVQGIDAGKNRLTSIDVRNCPELVELYVNDNRLTSIDLQANFKLKYFYCHGNRIEQLDTTNNPRLRHLNATDNRMREIRSLAPQRDERLPLEVRAGEGGYVGLKFNPVYNAQWKETGEWEQSYYAYPKDGFSFVGWFDKAGECVSTEATWVDEYGASRVLEARFTSE